MILSLAMLVCVPSASASATKATNTKAPPGREVIKHYRHLLRKQASFTQRYICPGAREYIVQKRNATWKWEDLLNVPRTKTSYGERTEIHCAHLRWSGKLWAKRADTRYRTYTSLQDPQKAICFVFGSYCSQALAVAGCESGHTYSVWAHNGQYLGMFQMGSLERRKYGHSNTALGQAKAAYAYFVDSGRDWSPWSCKP